MGQHLVTHDPCDPSDFRDPFDPWPMTHRPIPCSAGTHDVLWSLYDFFCLSYFDKYNSSCNIIYVFRFVLETILHVVHIKVFHRMHCSVFVCCCSFSPSFSGPSFSSPSFSSPANSTPATSSVIFQSCKFHPCDFVIHLPVLQIPPPVFWWSVIFQSCKFQSPH